MKIAIATTMVPHIYGGAEFLNDELEKQLILNGHKVEVIRFPFSWNPKKNILDSMMAIRLNKIENSDIVIAMKFPAYYIEHPNKKIWLVHQFRQAYDFVGTDYEFFDNSEEDQYIKKKIIEADNKYLREVSGDIFTISPIISKRLKHYNGIDSIPMCSPLIDEHIYSPGDFGEYIFYPSRVNSIKRQELAVKAMKFVKSKVKLVIAGKGDSIDDENNILKLIETLNLKDKVIYYNEFISQEKKALLYKKCLGSIYIPYDEDSYGYVTLESIFSEKPIITCNDSGGTDIVVKEGVTGYITNPDPQSIAEAMDKFYLYKAKTIEMGKNGIPLLKELGITWEDTIRRLLK